MLRALTPREASIFACLTDTVVAPADGLPPVHETDAALFFDRWMARSPALNRIGFRVLLHVVELAPLVQGFGGRLRQLPPERRGEWLVRFEKAGPPQLRQLAKLIKGFAALSYYGDDRVMLRVGYDAEARLARARELRAAEGRV